MRNEPLGVPGEHQKLARPIELIILVSMILLLFGQFLNFQQNQAIQETQEEGRERTFQTRAITCDLSKGIGIDEPAGCSHSEVVKWRDPRVKAASSASSRASMELKAVICSIMNRPQSTIVLDPALCKTG